MITTPLDRSTSGTSTPPSTVPAAAWALPAGLVGGILLGVAARLWMRLITTEPDFTWAGTLFIVGAFALFGLGQALSWSSGAAGRGRRRTTVARTVGAVLTLPLFTGAGAIMLPTVVSASLACWRCDWRRGPRLAVAALGLPVVVAVTVGIIDELGWGLRALGGIAGFGLIYTLVVVGLRPTVAPLADGWRLPRAARLLAVVVIGLVVALVAVTVIGF